MRRTATVLLVAAAVVSCLAAATLFGQVLPHSPGSAYFPDVAAGIAGDDHIGYLYEMEVTQGFPDGTYRPGSFVTRQEMAVYLARQRVVSYVDALLVADLFHGTGTYFGFNATDLTPEQRQQNYERMFRAEDMAIALGAEVFVPYGMPGVP